MIDPIEKYLLHCHNNPYEYLRYRWTKSLMYPRSILTFGKNMNVLKELHALMKIFNVLTKSDSYLCLSLTRKRISDRWKNAVMLFEEMPSASDWQNFEAKLLRLYLSPGFYPLLSLAMMLRGKKKRDRKARALRWRQPFPRVEHQFLVLRPLLLLVCDDDNVAYERVHPWRTFT